MALPVLSQRAGSCCCELPAPGSEEVLGTALPGVCCHGFSQLLDLYRGSPMGYMSLGASSCHNTGIAMAEGMQYQRRSYPLFSS